MLQSQYIIIGEYIIGTYIIMTINVIIYDWKAQSKTIHFSCFHLNQS